MSDTVRTLTALQTLLANNTSGDISPQDIRDFLVSVYPVAHQAEVDPTVDNDGANTAALDPAFYSQVGSLWVNTDDLPDNPARVFLCVDTTTGAAIWEYQLSFPLDLSNYEITTGLLTPNRGGTGADLSTSPYGLLQGGNDIPFSVLGDGSGDHAVYISSGEPAVGVLPISVGGTGQDLTGNTGVLIIEENTVSAVPLPLDSVFVSGLLQLDNGGTGADLSGQTGVLTASAEEGIAISATLPCAYGGTNTDMSGFGSNGFITGSGAGSWQVVASGETKAVYTLSGEPTIGVLPLIAGGTGADLSGTGLGQIVFSSDSSSALTTSTSLYFDDEGLALSVPTLALSDTDSAGHINTGSTNGSIIGQEDDKIGFFGVDPVVRQPQVSILDSDIATMAEMCDCINALTYYLTTLGLIGQPA